VIENDLQRQRTLALMEGFRKAVAKLANDGRELRQYDRLKSVKQGTTPPRQLSDS
jgi:hypothetical protein